MSAKTLSLYSLFLFAVLLTGASCKKTSSQGPVTKYRVTHIVDSAYYYNDFSYGNYPLIIDYRISYANNRIAGMVRTVTNPDNIPSAPSSDSATFTFHPFAYSIHHLINPLLPDSVIFNNLDEIITSEGGFNSASFSYNNNLQVSSFELNGSFTSSFGTYVWDVNNNISKIISTDTATVDYYTDKPNTMGDYNELIFFLTFGNNIVHTANLTKSIISSNSATNINYTFDNHGNIINTRSNTQNYYISSPTQTTTHSYTFEYEAYVL